MLKIDENKNGYQTASSLLIIVLAKIDRAIGFV